MTVDSEAAATALVQKVTGERSRGLFVDYTKSHNVTFAQLMGRYLSTVAPKKKSFGTMAYRIEGWLEDSGADGQRLLANYRHDLAQRGGKVRKAAFKMRMDISHLDWIHKRLTQRRAAGAVGPGREQGPGERPERRGTGGDEAAGPTA